MKIILIITMLSMTIVYYYKYKNMIKILTTTNNELKKMKVTLNT